ncbi:MAG: hypothetical protein KF781_06915 [Chitinophagaceae bacterium]|nr:hypothetical protein [Chitinophagaceae bacterium]MCW5904047.1 hypothetical protein [Chitinophagaceae bacterium]
MKQVFSFDKLDKELYRIFSNEAIIEPCRLIGNGINYFQAIQSNAFELLRSKLLTGQKSNRFQSIKIAIRSNGIDHNIKNVINLFAASKRIENLDDQVVFFCENFVPHILQDFIKMIKAMQGKCEIAFVTTDYRAFKFMKTYAVSHQFKTYLLKILQGKPRVYAALKNEYEVFFKTEVGKIIDEKYFNVIRKVFFKNLKLLQRFERTFSNFFEKYKPRIVVLGSDGFAVSRILCFVAAKQGIRTSVVQHGFLSSYNGYLPLIAKQIFVWTDFEKKFLSQQNIDKDRIAVVGAPRFVKDYNEIQVPTQLNETNILFVTSPVTTIEAARQISVGIDIYNRILNKANISFSLRLHPYYRSYMMSYVKKHYAKLIDDGKVSIDTLSFDKSLYKSDIIIFADISTTLFESIGNGKCCFLLNTEKRNSELIDLYNIPRLSIDEIVRMIDDNKKMMTYKNSLSQYKEKLSIEKTMKNIEIEILR